MTDETNPTMGGDAAAFHALNSRTTRRAIAARRAIESPRFLSHENMLRLLIVAQALEFAAGEHAPPEAKAFLRQALTLYKINAKKIAANKAKAVIAKPYPPAKTKFTVARTPEESK